MSQCGISPLIARNCTIIFFRKKYGGQKKGANRRRKQNLFNNSLESVERFWLKKGSAQGGKKKNVQTGENIDKNLRKTMPRQRNYI
jgi:hypothetical protein